MIDPAVSFIIVLAIGIIAGTLAPRILGTSWVSRQIAGRRGVVTSCLVGIAGSFIGYHIGILFGLSGSGAIALFIAAIVGAALILWAWKTLKL